MDIKEAIEIKDIDASIAALAGTGTRTVVADANGNLSAP